MTAELGGQCGSLVDDRTAVNDVKEIDREI
jgi:hypothetical protein